MRKAEALIRLSHIPAQKRPCVCCGEILRGSVRIMSSGNEKAQCLYCARHRKTEAWKSQTWESILRKLQPYMSDRELTEAEKNRVMTHNEKASAHKTAAGGLWKYVLSMRWSA